MSGLIKKIKNFLKDQRGIAAPLIVVFLTAGVGVVGAAIDLGMVYTAKSELQNAADAAAMAGAANLVAFDTEGNAIAQGDIAVYEAQNYASSNTSINQTIMLQSSDVTVGYWDKDLNDFDPNRTGMSSNPDDMTAIRVVTRRDGTSNGPVLTFFSRIFGIENVSITAKATSMLGYAAEAGEGGITLPIAVKEDALHLDDQNPECGKVLTFKSEVTENSEWTTFFTWPSNDVTVQRYITGELTSPPLEVGDQINTTNGSLSTATFNSLYDRFQSEAIDSDNDGSKDYWEAVLPVIGPTSDPLIQEVVGFMTMVITDVMNAPNKEITGYLVCDKVIIGSRSGGGNYGMRATRPTMVQ